MNLYVFVHPYVFVNPYEFGPVAAALDAASAALQAFSFLLEPLAGSASAALAVVLVTVIVRLALIPVGVSQARAQRMRARLAPRLAELQRRHRSDPQRLQRETMALYADEGTSPLAGCLPLLIQAPVLSLVYGVFVLANINGHANGLLSQTLLGAPLGGAFAPALAALGGAPAGGAAGAVGIAVGGASGGAAAGLAVMPASLVVGGIVLVLLAAVALSSRWFTLRTATPLAAGGGSAGGGSAPGGGVMRALSWMPLVTVVIAAFVPLAAALYLLVTTTWTLAERAVLHRLIT